MEEAAHVAWVKYSGQGLFLTGTHPGSTDESMECIAAYSGYLTDLLKHWLKDKLGKNFAVFGAWEPQKRGALHFHWCVQSLDRTALEAVKSEFHDYWRKLLVDLSRKTGIDLFRKDARKTWIQDARFPRTDAGWLRCNAGRYLAKYIGKDAARSQAGCKYHPSSWTTIDRTIANEAARHRIRVQLGGIDVCKARRIFQLAEALAQPLARNGFVYGNPMFAEDKTWLLRFDEDEHQEFLCAFLKEIDRLIQPE
jgi:hypothetical protein